MVFLVIVFGLWLDFLGLCFLDSTLLDFTWFAKVLAQNLKLVIKDTK